MRNTENRVERVDLVDLKVGPGTWAFARDRSAEIDALWARRSAENPHLFNGTVHLVNALRHAPGRLTAEFVRTDFKSYLYWRETGFSDASVIDGFGSALIRAGDGAVLLGRQREGNINGGLAYLPGGFIDGDDVRADGTIDLDASIARELEEETGLAAASFVRTPGYVLTYTGPLLSIAIEFTSGKDANELRREILTHLAADPHSELVDIVIVRDKSDLEGLAMPSYAGVLLTALI